MAVLVGAVVLLVAVAAVRLSVGTGLPSLLLYLALGLVLGESVIGIEFDDPALTRVLGYSALVLILAEGGLTTRWENIRGSIGPAVLLSTLGTAVSVGVVAVAAHFLLGLDWTLALLIGAVVSSTDAAAVFSVLRGLPLPRRLTGILEVESGLNDAPVVIAVVALTAMAAGESADSGWQLVLLAVGELAGGALIGLAVGFLGARRMRDVALPSSGLYPIAVMALCAAAYGGAAVAHTSGFIAVYLCALVLGNAHLPHRAAVQGFAEGVGWISQIGLFVLLGLLATPSRLPSAIVDALVIGLVLLLVARPLSVLATTTWFRIRWREQAFLSWGGLRGAVPVVLATVPAVAGLPGSERIFDLVFVLVVVFTLVQAPTLSLVARRLALISQEARHLDVEVSPLGTLGADVVQVSIGASSRLHGVEIFELRLPPGANVTLVVRDGQAFVPGGRTTLRRGDDLLVVALSSVRRVTEDRLRTVSSRGKLADWSPPDPPGS